MNFSLVQNGPLGKAWKAYDRALQKHRVITAACTSAGIWAVGDIVAQRLGERRKQLDARRCTLTAAFGGLVVGPFGTAWYAALDEHLKNTVLKILADAAIWNTFYLASYWAWCELLIERTGMKGLKKRMATEFIPTLVAEGLAWPPVMAFLFTKLPSTHHLLAVNLTNFLDVVFLALIRAGVVVLPSRKTAQQQVQQAAAAEAVAPAPASAAAASPAAACPVAAPAATTSAAAAAATAPPPPEAATPAAATAAELPAAGTYHSDHASTVTPVTALTPASLTLPQLPPQQQQQHKDLSQQRQQRRSRQRLQRLLRQPKPLLPQLGRGSKAHA